MTRSKSEGKGRKEQVTQLSQTALRICAMQ